MLTGVAGDDDENLKLIIWNLILIPTCMDNHI